MTQADLVDDGVREDADPPTIEDRFAALGDEDGDVADDEAIGEGETGDGDGLESGDDDPRAEEDEDADGAAPIAPPLSWTAAEKDAFAQLPRALQETLTRREGERERFVQAKAQEARAARSEIELEALETIQQLQATYVQHLHHFEAQLAVPEPDPRLIAEDPALYAAQLQRHRHYQAQREQAQILLAQAQARSAFAEREGAARAAETTRAALAEAFPEFLDPSTGPKLKQELGSTAVELGYTLEQLEHVDHVDILAMRTANEWRRDALKYRALMARKTDSVRAARDMPRVSRPGTSSGRKAAENQRYAADRQKMRAGDRDAAVRTFARFL